MKNQNSSYSVQIGKTTFIVCVKQSETAKKPIEKMFKDNVIVDMLPVGMSGNDKSVFAFQKAGGQFVANLICFLCCDFAGSEGLPYLIGDDIAFLAAPGGLLV